MIRNREEWVIRGRVGEWASGQVDGVDGAKV